MALLLLRIGSEILGIDTSAPGTLSVTGTDGLSPSGEEGGGSYLPSSVVYTLQNTGTTSINWTATKTAAWVSLSATSGTLAAGASTTVTVSVVAATIDALADGAYSDTVTFTNTTNGNGDTTRVVSLTVTAAAMGGGSEAAEVAQYGITWEFDDTYEVGQYANGDWWVVGPVEITAITKPLATAGRDGSMVNPSGNSNGYDSRIGSGSGAPAYSSALDVSLSFPFTLSPGESLCSCLSHTAISASPNNDTVVKAFAVLTCVSVAPAATALRPNFNHSTKYQFDTTDIDEGLLPTLSVSGSPPTIAQRLNGIVRAWPDHLKEFHVRSMHASDNMTCSAATWLSNGCCTYGRDHTVLLGEAMLLACCTEATVGDRTALVIALVQKGIDTYGALKGGATWIHNGGHGSGRKAIILFAGKLLGDAGMLAIGTDYPVSSTGYFGEDMQTFEIASGDVSRTLDMEVTVNVTSATSTTATGTLNRALNGYALLLGLQPTVGGVTPGGCYIEITSGTGIGQRRRLVGCTQVRGTTLAIGASITFTVDSAWDVTPDATSVITTIGYETGDIGTAEWGIVHRTFPTKDNPGIGADYRSNPTSPAWVAQDLVMRALSLTTAWSHDPFFDYMDRWMTITAVGGASQLQPTYRSWSTWAGAMWDAHRGSYP